MPYKDVSCDCGLDLSNISEKSPNMQIKCFHDGSVGLALHPQETYIKVRPGDSVEVRWRLTYPSDGGPPVLSEIGWDDEHRTTEEDNRSGAVPGGSSGGAAYASSLDAFTDEGTSLEAPDSFEPLLGYRAWLMTEQSGLKSTAHDTVWEEGKPTEAICQQFRDGHHVSFDLFQLRQELDSVPEAQRPAVQARIDQAIMRAKRSPERNCMCGLYAVSDPKNLKDRISEVPGLVYGRVKAWGKIAEYTEGFRAEKAEIDCLYLPKGFLKRRKVRRIAEAYGVPVVKAPKGVPSGIDPFPLGFTLFWVGFWVVGILGLQADGMLGYFGAVIGYSVAALVGVSILDKLHR